MPNKIDSNVTGLSYAEEAATIKTLPGTPVWYPLEPNSYADFGGQIKTVARKPINPSRQLRKGVTTDLDASGGFNQDLTFSNLTRLLQGFFFADVREDFTTQPMNGTAIALTATTVTNYTAAAGLTGVLANALVFASGFNTAGNNGLKLITSASTATVIATTGLTVETPSAAANLRVVGYQFASATLDVVIAGNTVVLNRASGVFDFTTLGLTPGEWVYVGGDTAPVRFTNNAGFARVSSVTVSTIVFDKVSWTPQAETGTGKTLNLFFGSVIKNELTPALIKRRTYQVERQLGNDGSGIMSEYLVGAVPNELTFNIGQADKVNIDLSFAALDNEQRTGVTGVKSGTRVTQAVESAFNTSYDITRIKLALATGAANITPLFAFATEMKLTIKNNVTPNKAIGVLGGFDASVGMFEVGGNMTAYFGDIAGVQAVRNNSDITLDILFQKKNVALLIDVPLLALGDGRLSVEMDQAITLPLETNAAQSAFGHTLLLNSFYYLPDVAGGL